LKFFHLAINNIKKKFGSYTIYLISAIFAVTIFSIFCSMYFNPQFSQYRFGSGKLAALFKISAVAVLIFASVFIFYANKFFVKTRKKEIAIYSLLGMKKSQIGRMLFYENILIGIIAIAGGILLGTLFTRFFCMIMLYLMKQVPSVNTGIQWEAIIITIVAFSVIFIINSFNAYIIIYKYRLIELLSSSKEGEKMPKYSVFGGIVSVIMIAGGYIYGLSIDFNEGGIRKLPATFLVIILVVAGTVLFFNNFIPMAVVWLKRNKNIYYKSTNFISLSQIVYRIKANSMMLSIIAILSAITVTMIGATFVLYKTFDKFSADYVPFSYLSQNINDEQYEEVVETINRIGDVSLLSTNRFTLIKAIGQNPKYAVVYDKQPGETITKVFQPGDPFDAYVLSASDYRKMIKNLKTKTGTYDNQGTNFNSNLSDQECYFIDGNMDTTYCKNVEGEVKLKVSETTESFAIKGVSMHKYLGVYKEIRKTTIVLNDKMYEKYLQSVGNDKKISFMGLMFDNPMNSKKTVDAINEIVPVGKDTFNLLGIRNLNYYDLNGVLYVQYGAYLFIGTFLGILFLLASSSIMYYKQIIEAQEEVERYDILKKAGMHKIEIKRSISKQLIVVFGMPLLIGLLHSGFAMITYNRIMMFVAKDISWAYIQEAFIGSIYIMIYYIFYMLSVKSYMKIVWDKLR